MTPEQQRIAIAEVCGWRKPAPYAQYAGYAASEVMISPQGKLEHINTVPRYTTDLNAMHEAEKVFGDIRDIRWALYSSKLAQVTHSAWIDGRQLVHATAAQRAEAFLRTLNLWKDETNS